MDNADRQGGGVIQSLDTHATDMPRRKKTNRKGMYMRIAGVVVVLSVLIFIFVYLPYLRIRKSAQAVMTSADTLKTAFKSNNIDTVNSSFKDFTDKYAVLRKNSSSIYWLSFIPYVADYKHGIEAGHYVVEAGKDALIAITPHADLIGFKKGQTSFTEKPAEDRLQTAVLTLDKVLGKLDTISENIGKAEAEMEKINPDRYPEKVGNTFIRGRIANVKEQFYGMSSLFVGAKPLLKQIPTIMGKDKEKTYLILFQNNYERRATGGFLTSYAYFRIKDGKMKVERSEDIYSMDNSLSSHPRAPREILTFHKGVSQFYIRDSNLSPDLPTSVKLFEGLYAKSNSKIAYDGIIMLDAKVLVDFLTIFGDTEVSGVRFSANEDKRCDCPQVIYTLFDIVDRPVNYVKTDRKGILGDLMYALFYKAIGFSPSKYWGTLAQTMYGNLEQKHIMLYFKDPALQAAAEHINFAGRIRAVDSDYLHVNNVNFAGAKSNLFVSEVIESKTTKNGDTIEREVTVSYKNPYPQSDCNLERGGLCLNAPLRNWIRVYVPEGSKLVSFTGAQRKTETYDELGKTVFENFLVVNPKGVAKVTVRYTLPTSIKPGEYSLMVQKQGGVMQEMQSLKVSINNQSVFDAPFAVDKMFSKPL